MTSTNPPTDQQLDDIEARAQAATDGPWCTDSWEIYQGTEYEPGLSLWIGETCRGTGSLEQDRADAEFVAHARTDVPALLAEVRRLRALLPTPTAVPTKDTPLSDYDIVELVVFAHKVESEGFGYAFEEYPPRFEAPELAPIAADYSLLRQLFDEWQEAVDEFWTRPDAGAVYDAHNGEARRRMQERAASAAVETGE